MIEKRVSLVELMDALEQEGVRGEEYERRIRQFLDGRQDPNEQASGEDWEQIEFQEGGVFSKGGAVAGGIFGDGVIATTTHDPESRYRGAIIRNAETQDRILRELREERRLLAAQNRRLLEQLDAVNEERRLLAAKEDK